MGDDDDIIERMASTDFIPDLRKHISVHHPETKQHAKVLQGLLQPLRADRITMSQTLEKALFRQGMPTFINDVKGIKADLQLLSRKLDQMQETVLARFTSTLPLIASEIAND